MKLSFLAPLFLLFIFIACQNSTYVKIESDKATERRDYTAIENSKPLDILFVMDSSASMIDEQDLVSKNFTTIEDPKKECTEKRCKFCDQSPEKLGFLETLACSANDFRIGFISTDFDDHKGKLFMPSGTVNPILVDSRKDNKIQIIEKFKQGIKVGGKGSTFEQGIRAAWETLNPKNVGPSYFSNYLRKDGIVVIIFISDEDDCSYKERSFKDYKGDKIPDDQLYGDVCYKYAEQLSPVGGKDGFVEKFKSLKPDSKDVVIGAIVGGAIWKPLDANKPSSVDCVLTDNGPMQTPLCTDPSLKRDVSKFPNPEDDSYFVKDPGGAEGACGGKRYFQMVDGLSGVFDTICQRDFKESLKKIADFVVVGSGYTLSKFPRCTLKADGKSIKLEKEIMSACPLEIKVVRHKRGYQTTKEVINSLSNCPNPGAEACLIKSCPENSLENCWKFEVSKENKPRIRLYGEEVLPAENEAIDIFFLVDLFQ